MWNESVVIEVIEVHRSWALIACQAYGDTGLGSVWTKRQPLPFPESFIPGEKEERNDGPGEADLPAG